MRPRGTSDSNAQPSHPKRTVAGTEDTNTGRTCFVLDTKYKSPDKPSSEDIMQVVAYAEAKNCRNAGLVYPVSLPVPIAGFWGRDIHVESLAFQLDEDLDEAGQRLLQRLLFRIENAAEPAQ